MEPMVADLVKRHVPWSNHLAVGRHGFYVIGGLGGDLAALPLVETKSGGGLSYDAVVGLVIYCPGFHSDTCFVISCPRRASQYSRISAQSVRGYPANDFLAFVSNGDFPCLKRCGGNDYRFTKDRPGGN